jgi:hypothetical protein
VSFPSIFVQLLQCSFPVAFIFSVFVLILPTIIDAAIIKDAPNPPNYCINQTESCFYHGQKHFACNHTREFSPTCSSIHEIVAMTTARINDILHHHNTLRSLTASGFLSTDSNQPNFPPASRMATLKWSQELSDLALLNAKQCKMHHDICHNTAEFQFSGQNLGISSTNIKFEDPDAVISRLTNAWFDEYKAANGTNIANCCFSYSG